MLLISLMFVVIAFRDDLNMTSFEVGRVGFVDGIDKEDIVW
jgi:hypothetical protein